MFKTEEDLKKAFKIAAQAEKLRLKDGSFPPFVLPNEIEMMQYVFDNLLPKIKELRTRQIIWLRSQGKCWKSVAKEVGLTESQVKRIFVKEIALLRKT